ncbi:MAG TPA: patatin-like phospholipase family protein [Micromonosporaceae bacterium]
MATTLRPRVGLVLGAGGALGAAWTAGALAALQERLDRPVPDVDMIVGTSAGSVVAASLRCGVGVDEIVAYQRGLALATLPHLADLDKESGALPPLPRLRLGSPRLLAATARAPHRVHPWVAASALLPAGRAEHRCLAGLVNSLVSHANGGADGSAVATHLDGRAVAADGRTWIMSVDYGSGRRVAFGRPGAPTASLSDAVVASCSIPGWHRPKIIDGRPYVDGGVRSSTSLDLLTRVELDEVYVLAPMASFDPDRPRHPAARAERLVRQLVTKGLAGEIRAVQATGATVRVLTPGPEDLAAIGANMMEPSRRLRVLETSLATSPIRLAALDKRSHRASTRVL